MRAARYGATIAVRRYARRARRSRPAAGHLADAGVDCWCAAVALDQTGSSPRPTVHHLFFVARRFALALAARPSSRGAALARDGGEWWPLSRRPSDRTGPGPKDPLIDRAARQSRAVRLWRAAERSTCTRSLLDGRTPRDGHLFAGRQWTARSHSAERPGLSPFRPTTRLPPRRSLATVGAPQFDDDDRRPTTTTSTAAPPYIKKDPSRSVRGQSLLGGAGVNRTRPFFFLPVRDSRATVGRRLDEDEERCIMGTGSRGAGRDPWPALAAAALICWISWIPSLVHSALPAGKALST